MKSSPKSIQNILVRSPNWIGDQILAYPFFHYLREAYPKARIGVSCVSWVESIQFRNLVDQVYVLPKAESRSFSDRWKALSEAAKVLRAAGPWDLGIALPNSFSAAWLLFRAGAKIRRGYSTDGRGILLNERLYWDSEKFSHRSEAYLKLLPQDSLLSSKLRAKDFWGVPPLHDLDPGVPGVLNEFDAEKAWPNTVDLVEPPSFPYWILAPGSTAESRRWSEQSFLNVARQIVEATGWKGLVIGGLSELDLASRLTSDPNFKLEDWTGRGSVASYWKVFKNARLSLCNDSGLAHIAALCGSPTQIVWGAGDPKHTEPLGPGKVRVIFNPVECWPCERNQCSQQLLERKLECLKGIRPDAVWKEIRSGFRPEQPR